MSHQHTNPVGATPVGRVRLHAADQPADRQFTAELVAALAAAQIVSAPAAEFVGFGAQFNGWLYSKPNWGLVTEQNVKDLEAKIIDLATLTGACVVALGPLCSGLMANDQRLADRLLRAARGAGERVWQLPLIDEYKEQFRSDVADLNNTGGRNGGAITAGLFLREFAGDIPWAHLDIAGPAFVDKDLPLGPKGATGVGVRTLLTYFTDGK